MVMRRPILVSNQTKPGGNTTHDRFKCYQRAGEKTTVIHYRRGTYRYGFSCNQSEIANMSGHRHILKSEECKWPPTILGKRSRLGGLSSLPRQEC